MNKVIRRKNTNYTTISNVFVRDAKLSLKAKGLLSVIMSLPEDWDFTIAGIVAILKEGKTSIYNTINELKENGYCFTQIERNEKGVIVGNNYMFFEEPQTEQPYTETPHTENPHTDNTPQLNKDNNKIKNELSKDVTPSKDFDADTTKEKKTLFRNSPTAQLVEYSNADGMPVDYSKFCALFPGEEFKRIDLVYYYNVVADWSDQKNMKRTNRGWIATIRNFIRGDIEKNRLHLLPQYQPNDAATINVDDALEFLKM